MPTGYQSPLESVPRRRLAAVVIIIIVGVAAVLRLHHLQSKQFWGDEVHTYLVANLSGSLADLWNRCWQTGLVADPPLYYLLSHYSVPQPFWHTEAALRMLSVLFGVGSVFLIYVIVRRLRGEFAACIAAALLALSAFAIQYSQEHRPYSMLLFTSLLLYDALLRASSRINWRLWLYVVFAAALLIYTHFFGGFALASAYVVWSIRMIVMYRRTRQGRYLLAMFSLPVVLTILYIPVILKASPFLHKMSIVVDPNGSGTQQTVNEWLASRKSPIGYAGEQLKAFAAWRAGSAPLLWYVFAGVIAVLGMLRGFKRSPWLSAAIVFCIVTGFAMSVAFYDGLKFPFDARRGIFLLPFAILFATDGLMIPAAIGTRARRIWVYVSGLALTILLLVTALTGEASVYVAYDAHGWRNEASQADWRGMAKYVGQEARPNDLCAVPIPNGRTWIRLHYAFYHEVFAGRVPIVLPRAVGDIEECLVKASGLWLIVAEPQNLSDDMFAYLLAEGQWKTFFGGAVVYLPGSSAGTRHLSLLTLDRAPAALSFVRGSFTGDVVLTSPLRATLRFDAETTFSLLGMEEGPQEFDLHPAGNDTPCTFGIFRRVPLGQWQPAIEFSVLLPSSKLVNFPLKDDKPFLFLRHNGSAYYYIYVDEPGYYYLSMEAANDRPGPIRARVFFSQTGEGPRFVWGRANNRFSTVRGKVLLPQGPVIMTVYYDSFTRLENSSITDLDSANSFKFTRWKLEKAEGTARALAAGVDIQKDDDLATSTSGQGKWPVVTGEFAGNPTDPVIYRSDKTINPFR